MELYYNPERMDDAEIKGTFVGRQWLLDDLLATVKRQRKGAGVQHIVLIGPRGMGKTTMLLMLRFGIVESSLAKSWVPVRFPEESYGINDLADFWLTTMQHLAQEASDASLTETVDKLKHQFADSVSLGDAAVAALRDWCRARKKRLVLLVDNLDMILDQIRDDADSARLRDVLMNDGTFMLVGTATSFFREARAYDQPLYNFFKTYNLESLEDAQVYDLLRHRAAADGVADFEDRLKQNAVRIKVLHYFTGGSPRLVLMLYRIVASSDFTDIRRSMEKLLDEVTPYYKAKVESLPPQPRKILDCIARVSAKTHLAVTPTEIAKETRLPVNQVSAQLKRLSDLGYVRAANVRSKNAYYSLAEALYSIWHQMRFGREGRANMEWLVEFLRAWYTSEEILAKISRLTDPMLCELQNLRFEEAVKLLDQREFLVEAAEEPRREVLRRESLVRSALVFRLLVDNSKIEAAQNVLERMFSRGDNRERAMAVASLCVFAWDCEKLDFPKALLDSPLFKFMKLAHEEGLEKLPLEWKGLKPVLVGRDFMLAVSRGPGTSTN